MKQLLVIITGVFLTISVYADCATHALWVFPNGKTIKQNSIFVLNGYFQSQQVILELNKKHPVYLKSGQKTIKLLVTEICVGQFMLTQAILKPETALEAGVEYTMYIDSLPMYNKFERFNDVTHKAEPVTFNVITENDTEAPEVASRPKELKKMLAYYGCGPSIHVVFSNPATDKSELLVKTTVKSVKTGKETTYYIEPNGDKINVGHGMCSGAFDFDDGDEYEAAFSFMDLCGNLTAWTGERIKFTRPVKETRDERE